MSLVELQKLLLKGEDYERCEAAELIGELGAAAASVVPDLCKVLAEDDADLRYLAADALRKIGSPDALKVISEIAIPMFLEQLASSDPFERSDAAIALGEFGELSAVAVPALCLCLEDLEGELAFHAVEALRMIGGEQAENALESFSASHVDILKAALELDDDEERQFAIFALKKIGTSAALEVLATAEQE
jgi:HEAT repeat protein